MEDLVCFECIDDLYLKSMIKNIGKKKTCSFCKETNKAYSLVGICEFIDRAIRDLYIPTASEPEGYALALVKDKESSYEWEREGMELSEVLSEILDVTDELSEKILSILRDNYDDYNSYKDGVEGFYDNDVRYEEYLVNKENLSQSWLEFENKIKVESRFFGHQEFLDKIFNDIQEIHELSNKPIIQVIGPDKEINHIFRARLVHPEKLVHTLENLDIELATPPLHLRRAGRMNPQGISVFYGALEQSTAIAEVRPTIKSKVVVGKFDLKKDLRILDLNSLSKIEIKGSVFDSKYRERLELVNFLSGLGNRMSMPVHPDDEAYEYLATQIIADYLTWKKELNIQGIMYPSAYSQTDGQNVVILNPAIVIDREDSKYKLRARASLGYEDSDGFNEEITIQEVFYNKPVGLFRFSDDFGLLSEEDKVTLRLEKKNIEIFSIEKVLLKYSASSVEYSREVTETLEEPSYDF